jgi:hypothetical protein
MKNLDSEKLKIIFLGIIAVSTAILAYRFDDLIDILTVFANK